MSKLPDRLSSLTSEKTEFKREISLFGGVNILVGIIIGSGIFYLGSMVMEICGMNVMQSLLCWVIGGVVSLLGGLCLAELGAMMPRAGGTTLYLNEAYSPAVGFMSGFTHWVITGPCSNAAVALALPAALAPLLPMSQFAQQMFGVVLIVLLTVLNIYGVKLGTAVQNVSTIAKVIPLFLIIGVGIFKGSETVSLSFAGSESGGAFSMISMIAMAVMMTMWAYEGWANLNNVAEELKNPKKNLPLAIIIALGFITLLYVLFNFAVARSIPMGEAAALIESGEYYLGTIASERLMGQTGMVVVVVGMAISMLGSLNGGLLAFPRVYYRMAEDGYFFKSFAKLHPVYKTPYMALIVQCVISCALLFTRTIDQLTMLVVFAQLVFNLLAIIAVIILRKKYKSMERPYKIWGYPVTVVITALAFLGLGVSTLIDDPETALIGLVVPLIGYFVYRFFKKRREA